jgi:uncharacterized protein
MALTLKTPGVYIEEKNAFPNSVVAVATAIPAFIGYTESANFKGKSLLNQPVKVDSFLEFENFFGKGATTTYGFAKLEGDAAEPDIHIGADPYALKPDANTLFYMYESLKLFYQNGGGTCYIVSVGTYGGGKVTPDISMDPFITGLKTLEKEMEPTMIVTPDALLLDAANCYSLQQQVLNHCGVQKNRVAILDVYNGFKGLDDPTYNPITDFRNQVSSDFLKFGAAYYPWLKTTIVQPREVTYRNLNADGVKLLQDLCASDVALLNKNQQDAIKAYVDALTVPEGTADALSTATVHSVLSIAVPIYKTIMDTITEKKNLLPPSGAIAGIYTRVDNERGVWKAPANVAVNSAIAPAVHIDHNQQEDLNAPILGKAICAIRPFIGLGTMVWGARTLDANSLDWRYINVRRTMIMLEQSIKFAANAYVFEPNVKNTWVTIQSMITNFLTNLWKQGALAGAQPADAFEVNVGLGTTMTAVDILEGIMRIEVKVAVSRPAEFIVITFEQQMQKS